MNGMRAIWLVYQIDTNVHGFWLVNWTLGWKNFMSRELSRNQWIPRYDIMLQHDWPMEECLLHIRVFFGGKLKRPCFDLFIHSPIKQQQQKKLTNSYQNHFSRSFENRSISLFAVCKTKTKQKSADLEKYNACHFLFPLLQSMLFIIFLKLINNS